MRDKKIISIIDKIYWMAGSLLAFILFSLLLSFLIIYNGFYIQNFSSNDLTIKNLYIKWEDGLNISVDALEITQKSQNTQTDDPKELVEDLFTLLPYAPDLIALCDTLLIEKLTYGKNQISIKKRTKEAMQLRLKNADVTLETAINFYGNTIFIALQQLTLDTVELQAKGSIVVDLLKERIYTSIELTQAQTLHAHLYALATAESLRYKVEAKSPIADVTALLQSLQLPKDLHLWTLEAIDAKSALLQELEGTLHYNDLASAYKEVSAKVTLNRLNYTYNPQLDAIHTQTTELVFKKGVLYIYPKEATTYGIALQKSWLKIDFTQPHEYLTLHLLFDDGILNKDVLHILHTYAIDLPFLQHSGTVATDLTLHVDLRTIAVDAKGSFFTKKANFDYLGLNIDVEDASILLDNYAITIPKMRLHYKDIATADLMVNYNAKNGQGFLDFTLKKVALRDLLSLKQPLHLTYSIHPKHDTISVAKSQWKLLDHNASVDALVIPFDLKTLQLQVPPLYWSVEDIANGYAMGSYNLKTKVADFAIDLLHLNYEGIRLQQTDATLHLHYDKTATLTSSDPLYLRVKGSPYRIENLHITGDSNHLAFENLYLAISKYIKTKVSANYTFATQKATIGLDNFVLFNQNTQKIYYYKRHIDLNLTKTLERITINSPALRSDFTLESDGWKLKLNALKVLAKNSYFLQRYKIEKGSVTFYKKSSDSYAKFLAKVTYPYALLRHKDKALHRYKIAGYITKKQSIYLTVNKKINMKISDIVKIAMHDTVIDTNALLKFVSFVQKASHTTKDQESMDLFLDAKNTTLALGHGRFVLSDHISLQYFKNILTAQLYHKKGEASFRLQEKLFHLYGTNFGDLFMEKLFALSKFKGGRLDFSMSGLLDAYKGIFYVKDTTMLDYVLLNNILAFINTVPSLATFSLPGYNKNGLYIDNAYLNFQAKKGLFTLSDIYVGSKEMTIVGKGVADIPNNGIDLTLNLKTDLGSNLSKVPLVGYIILDGDTIATTLKVTGKLNDPKVESMLAREIVVAPLNIILRTLTLPYKLLKDTKETLQKLK